MGLFFFSEAFVLVFLRVLCSFCASRVGLCGFLRGLHVSFLRGFFCVGFSLSFRYWFITKKGFDRLFIDKILQVYSIISLFCYKFVVFQLAIQQIFVG